VFNAYANQTVTRTRDTRDKYPVANIFWLIPPGHPLADGSFCTERASCKGGDKRPKIRFLAMTR